ncbi:MAG TPA: tetratricopeptide repeat protein [Pyrinomonadaceae bacterium]|nr:tetratricopeptide repeat protein [Pyrinomonadaceae bacterium]
MLAVKALIQKIPDPGLSTNERVRLRCSLAREFEKTGNFDAACGAMDNLWLGVGIRPNLDMLDHSTTAEVLLRVGVLTGWIGNIRVIKGSQESARSLLTESIAIFQTLGDIKKVAEAQIEMALCWIREGSFDTANTLLIEALAQLDDSDGDLKALAVLRSAMIEMHYSRPKDALKLLTQSASVFEASSYLRGPFHNEVAIALKRLGASGSREDYVDSVLREYSASRFHLSQLGHTRYLGVVENNIAMFCLELGRFTEAHEHLDRAQALYTRINDRIHHAELEDSRARVLLGEGAILKAERVIDAAIRILEKGDQKPALAEALTTRAVVLARLKRTEEARATFTRAIDTAEQAGDLEKAGLAAMALIEELPEHLTEDELCSLVENARAFLKHTQSTTTLRRLTECAWRALSTIHTARPDWTTFSLNETLRRHEARFIQMALEDTGGSVTKAAALLGLAGHQSLNFILHRRHPELLNARRPIKPRRRSTLKLV